MFVKYLIYNKLNSILATSLLEDNQCETVNNSRGQNNINKKEGGN